MLGIVTGLQAEARIAGRLGLAVAGGGSEAGARRAAELLVSRGATRLLSFGVAGGLDPALLPGALVVPSQVIGQGGIFRADAALVAALRGPTAEFIVASSIVVASARDKARLRAASGAAAVDMESGAVAAVAAAHGLAFAVLRAICDPAARDLPPAALAALDAGGAIMALRVGASVLRDPAQIPALFKLAADAARARSALRKYVLGVGDIGAVPVSVEDR